MCRVRGFRDVLLAVGCLSVWSAPPQAVAAVWQAGYVFAGVANGQYKVYDGAGNLLETLDDGMGGFTTGCAHDPSLTRLYTTNFSNTKVVVYDANDPHPILDVIDTALQVPGGQSESIVFDSSGNFYVGHPDGNDDILKYDAAHVFQQAFDVPIEDRGSDWMTLHSDDCTMFYTSEGVRILRYNVCTDAALADFATVPNGPIFALRLLPPFDGTGGLMVAATANIHRLDATGVSVQTYDAPGEDAWFSLNLDPDGTSFWAGSSSTDNFYKFDIATGAVVLGPINAGPGNTLFGLCVWGEPGQTDLTVAFDLKPGSCPNPINMKMKSSNAVIPTAILGTATFDVTTIDPTTVELEGVPALRWSVEDVSRPVTDGTDCECTTAGPDGYPDLTLKFNYLAVVKALGPQIDGDLVPVEVTGNLNDDTPFTGTDCFLIRHGVTVLAPAGGNVVRGGAPQDITWNTVDVDLTPDRVDLLLSMDGGATYEPIAIALTDTGSYSWHVPAIATSTARIKVVVHDTLDQSEEDESDTDFRIESPTGAPDIFRVPTAAFLAPATPQPFRDATTVRFGLPTATTADLSVYSLDGRRVRRLVSGQFPAGVWERTWDARNETGERVSAGVYLVRLATADATFAQRLVLVR